METAEPFLTFIADIIHYIAWPAAVITIVVLLRHPIKAMFGRIKHIRGKKGDAELTLDLIEKTVEAFTEEKPGVILLTEVTRENLNWKTYLAAIKTLQSYVTLYLNYVPFDEVNRNPDFLRHSVHIIETTSPFLEKHIPAPELADMKGILPKMRRRFAPILDNAS